MVNNFTLQVKTNDQAFSVVLQRETHKSSSTVTIGGINYSLQGPPKNVEFFRQLFKDLPNDSFRSFEAVKASLLNDKGIENVNVTSNRVHSLALNVINQTPFDIKGIINNTCDLLKEKYIFPEVAKKCALYIQNEFKNGAYQNITDPETLAQVLTADLRLIAEDKHMGVYKTETKMKDEVLAPPNEKMVIEDLEKINYGLKAKKLPGHETVGYLELSDFFAVDKSESEYSEFPHAVENTRLAIQKTIGEFKGSEAIIIDLRNNGGGSPHAVQLICSYFLDANLPLNTMKWRKDKGEEIQVFNTLSNEEISPNLRLTNQPIYVLTSHKTFSAAEEFTNNMKVLGRATIVGEVTGGGANPCRLFPLDKDNLFEIVIPNGQAINPITGTNWEGKGVIPDHVSIILYCYTVFHGDGYFGLAIP